MRELSVVPCDRQSLTLGTSLVDQPTLLADDTELVTSTTSRCGAGNDVYLVGHSAVLSEVVVVQGKRQNVTHKCLVERLRVRLLLADITDGEVTL